jgi:hypothetical protein
VDSTSVVLGPMGIRCSVRGWSAVYGEVLTSQQTARRAGRQWHRIPIKELALLVVQSEAGPREFSGFTIDSSPQGVRVQTDHYSLAPGEIVELIFTEGQKRDVRCRVVWVGPPGSGRYGHAGMEFLSPL